MCYVQAIGYAQEGDVLLHERGDATNGEGSERGLLGDDTVEGVEATQSSQKM